MKQTPHRIAARTLDAVRGLIEKLATLEAFTFYVDKDISGGPVAVHLHFHRGDLWVSVNPTDDTILLDTSEAQLMGLQPTNAFDDPVYAGLQGSILAGSWLLSDFYGNDEGLQVQFRSTDDRFLGTFQFMTASSYLFVRSVVPNT